MIGHLPQPNGPIVACSGQPTTIRRQLGILNGVPVTLEAGHPLTGRHRKEFGRSIQPRDPRRNDQRRAVGRKMQRIHLARNAVDHPLDAATCGVSKLHPTRRSQRQDLAIR